MDINELASLLHLEEKLRGHPKWDQLYKAVVGEIDKINELHKAPSAESKEQPDGEG